MQAVGIKGRNILEALLAQISELSPDLAPDLIVGRRRDADAAGFGDAALALLGSLDQAKAAAKAGLALDPSFTIRRFRDGAPSDDPTFLAKRERLYQGMRMAGVPEG